MGFNLFKTDPPHLFHNHQRPVRIAQRHFVQQDVAFFFVALHGIFDAVEGTLSCPVALPFLNHGFMLARLFIVAHTYKQNFSGKACEGSGVAFFLDCRMTVSAVLSHLSSMTRAGFSACCGRDRNARSANPLPVGNSRTML